MSLFGRFRARCYDFYMDRMDRAGAAEHRRRLVREAAGEVLEIGVGTGKNLPLHGVAERALKVLRSIHKSLVSSSVTTLAERPRLSATLISPRTSPAPSTASTTSVPSERIAWTLTEAERIT